jgi:hypothetical protein
MGLSTRAVLGEVGQGLGKKHVRSRFPAGGGAIQGGIQPFHGQGVGARHDHESGIGFGIDGGLDAIDHLGKRHDGLARAVSAPLGRHLILDVDAGRARLDEFLDGAGDHMGRAETGIRIRQ